MTAIVVGLDFSRAGRSVLDVAARVARDRDAELVALHVVPMLLGTGFDTASVATAVTMERATRDADDELKKLVAQLPTGVRCRRKVVLGFPWQELSETARTEHADMIIIGAHNYDTLDRMLGTTAAQVINHARRNVLVVRDAAALVQAPERPVLVAVDETAFADSVLRNAVREAKLTGKKLAVLRAFPDLGTPVAQPGDSRQLVERLVGSTRKAVEDMLERVDVKGASVHVAAGTPWRLIVAEAERLAAGLIVVGAHSHRDLRHLTGSTAAHVVNHARTNVLMLEPLDA